MRDSAGYKIAGWQVVAMCRQREKIGIIRKAMPVKHASYETLIPSLHVRVIARHDSELHCSVKANRTEPPAGLNFKRAVAAYSGLRLPKLLHWTLQPPQHLVFHKRVARRLRRRCLSPHPPSPPPRLENCMRNECHVNGSR